ncbi:Mrp/NBP35 family ATP-binding protein [Bacteroidia bacterium]|nr:Mrp/NBP35 family ATP-binding protein [Bacteroidia bacterium]MDB9883201.1 Mrp/NBP35 family ATP-binding protein [Bacteroidia bacterium]
MISTEQVLKALSYVDDPDLNKDLVTLNMIQKVKIEGKEIAFDLVLTTPACPMKDSIANACKTAIHTMVAKDALVNINITSNVQVSRDNNTVLSSVKNIIAVASGKGGVGKSTVAINLAKTLSRAGAKVGLLDADIHGPSIPTLMGTQGQKPEMEGNLMLPIEKDGLKTMSIGYLVEGNQALVWRGPMLSKAITQFCSDVKWGELDYLFVDLPPGTGDAHLSIIQHIPLSGVVIVSTPEDVAVADTHKAIDMFTNPHLKQEVLGVVENMSFFQPGIDGEKYYLFGKGGGEELCSEWKLDLLGQIPVKENKSFENMHSSYLPIVGKVVQKLSVLAANR